MGLPARKIESDAPRARAARPVAVANGPARKTRPCNGTTAARRTFRRFAFLTVVVCALGLGRVWLSVQAAEASIEAGELRGMIKTERYKGDMLEVQQSALSSPSRIRAIAGATMDMASGADVTYLDLAPATQDVAAGGRTDRVSKLESAMSDVLSLAAGEAHVLLVGDVGLASAR